MPAIRSPRHKLSRREGVDLFGNGGESLQRRLNKLPGQTSQRPPRQQSEYGRQLREKQKVKRMYGMREKQFRRFFSLASRSKGITGYEMLKLLERRLDNIVYRLGFSVTRLQSRQLVSHGHVFVDGKRVNIASYLVKPGASIQLDATAQAIPSVKELLDGKVAVPGWLERSSEPGAGRVLRDPERGEIDPGIQETLIVEFYSR